jgi:hypothetical protein
MHLNSFETALKYVNTCIAICDLEINTTRFMDNFSRLSKIKSQFILEKEEK